MDNLLHYSESGVIPFSGASIPGTIDPINPLNSPGYIKLKPTKQYSSKPTVMIKIFLNRICYITPFPFSKTIIPFFIRLY